MPLVAVDSPAAPDSSWAAVLESATENIGSDPLVLWHAALARAGSETIAHDGDEHTSNCPSPGHNGGTGDAKKSMRWRQAADGQILFTCRAGCEGQDILDSLSLSFVQLRWARTEYSYRSDLRELLSVHCKTPTHGGGKKFWWEHLENGTLHHGRSAAWEPVLWCLPDLIQFARQAHEQGKKIHLWLCEGEKDCLSVADAFMQSWIDTEQQGADWVHLATTNADGGASWSIALSEQVLSLGCSQITLVCDSDQTGTNRGTQMVDALREAAPALSVRALNWVGQPGVKDASDAIQAYGRHWLQRATPTADADIYLWCSVDTGWLKEADPADSRGEPTGKRALHRVTKPGTRQAREEAITKWPLRVTSVTKNIEGHEMGWEVDLGAGGRALIKLTDIDSGSNLEKWNARHGLFVVPTRSLTAPLRAYLGYHGNNVSSLTVYDHEGWVDNERFVTRTGLLIGPEGESGSAVLGGTDGPGAGADWHYGLGDEREAADHMAKLLTFRELPESGCVLAWLTAQAVRPRALAASGASFVPMLQIPGASGIGKTSFLKLATRLFGFSGNAISNVTSAGLVRTLALTTGIVWIDDFTNYDDTIRDIIRGGITGAGRTRGTTTSERGVVRDEAYASLINSGEHAFDANERAMSQRSVVLEFTQAVQGRRTKTGSSQYHELELLGVTRDDKGTGLSRWAGTVMRGLWQAAAEIDAIGLGRGEGNGVRGQAAWEFVQYGALVLGQWLRNCGFDAGRIQHMEEIILLRCRTEAEDAARREKSGADIFLVQETIPRYLGWARQRMDPGINAQTSMADPYDLDEIRAAIRTSWNNASGAGVGTSKMVGEQTPRAVVILTTKDAEEHDQPYAVAVNADGLYKWATSSEGLRAGASTDERHVSSSGISMQLKQVADKNLKTLSSGDKDGSFRVRFTRGTQVPRYRLITEPEIIRWLCE